MHVLKKLRLGRKLERLRQLLLRPRYETLFAYYRYVHSAAILDTRPVRTPASGAWVIRYLTCKEQLLETIWSAKSLLRFAEAPLCFHEDGSFDRECVRLLRSHFPDASVISRRESDERTDPLLSKSCRDWRNRLVFFLRVFDFQLWADGQPYLQVDSDVLFFESPRELLAGGPLVRFNCGRLDDSSNLAWGLGHIRDATGISLTGGFNAGLVYMPHRIDFASVENWLSALGEPINAWTAEQTILNLASATMGMKALPARYDIYEQHWPDVVSEHYVERTRLNMYRRGYPVLRRRLS